MKSSWKTSLGRLIVATGIFLAFTIATRAQVKTTTSTTEGTSTKEFKVDRAVVEHVSGNDVWVKMEDGQVRHIGQPESHRIASSRAGPSHPVRNPVPSLRVEPATRRGALRGAQLSPAPERRSHAERRSPISAARSLPSREL